MAKAELAAAVTPKLQRVADGMGYELVEVALDREPGGKFLRVYIDKPEGITLDDCEKFHRAVLPLVENYDYDYMEVSSPGIDRPLKTDRDFDRNLGVEVEIRLFRPMDGAKEWTGTLAGLEDGEIVLVTPSGEKRIPRKAAALVKPVVDLEGIEEVDLGEDQEL